MRAKPMNLNLFTIAFPVTAIVSILHRISGALLFLLIPVLLLSLQKAVYFPSFFNLTVTHKICLWLGLTILMYHLFAGVRHLLMDCGWGESKSVSRLSSYMVLGLTAIISILLGFSL